MRHRVPRYLVIAAICLPPVSCRSGSGGGVPIVQPGAPGEASRVIGAAKASDLSRVQHTAADVRFVQGMIGHHAQAIEMTDLLRTRTASEDMRRLGQRIAISQADEIEMMRDWLRRRRQPLPDAHAHHGPGGLMPGMLTAQEMAELGAAKGAAFDRLFLQLMMKHHEGALKMVQDLFATPGAGQEADLFAFASDVDADQRMEIDRMTAMLDKVKELQQ